VLTFLICSFGSNEFVTILCLLLEGRHGISIMAVSIIATLMFLAVAASFVTSLQMMFNVLDEASMNITAILTSSF
jgi:hypothetical protein